MFAKDDEPILIRIKLVGNLLACRSTPESHGKITANHIEPPHLKRYVRTINFTLLPLYRDVATPPTVVNRKWEFCSFVEQYHCVLDALLQWPFDQLLVTT